MNLDQNAECNIKMSANTKMNFRHTSCTYLLYMLVYFMSR